MRYAAADCAPGAVGEGERSISTPDREHDEHPPAGTKYAPQSTVSCFGHMPSCPCPLPGPIAVPIAVKNGLPAGRRKGTRGLKRG